MEALTKGIRFWIIVVIILSLLMLSTLYLALVWVPPAKGLGESSRVVYFHVPLAWVSTVAFAVAGISSIVFLRKKELLYVYIAQSSAIVGFVFCVLTVVTGSFWAKVMWGSFWNWDPRETSIMLLLLIYIAYFNLHHMVKQSLQGKVLESVYLIVAFVVSPFLIFVVPRMYASLHPEPIVNISGEIHLDREMQVVLLLSLVSFTLLYCVLVYLLTRLRVLESLCVEDRL